MSITYQTYFSVMDPAANISIEHEMYIVYYLSKIFKEIYPHYFLKDHSAGRKKIYTPETMLPFITWGNYRGNMSCRSLEKLWKDNNDVCNLILDCKKPGKSSINEFQNQYSYLIDEFDIFIVEFSLKIGLMGGEIIYNDGTILKGFCSNFKKVYANQLYYIRDFIMKHRKETSKDGLWYKLKRYFEENKFKEEIEPILKDLKAKIRAGGMLLLEEAVKNKKSWKNVLIKIKQMEENVKGNRPISISDPEAHSMKDKDGQWGFNYNYQVAVDDKFGMIAMHYVTQSPNDIKELLNVVNRLNEILPSRKYVIVVDNGYWHIKSLHEIYNSPTTIIIPDRYAASKTKNRLMQEKKNTPPSSDDDDGEEDRFKKRNFHYDDKTDTYKCPNNCILTRQNNITQNGIEYRVYSSNECKTCPDHDKCTKESKRKIKDRYDPILDSIRDDYYSEFGQETYPKRGSKSEGIFAILFESRNFRGLRTTGLKRANDEMTLTAITHNLKKINKHLEISVLKTILKLIIEAKKEHGHVNMSIFDNWKDKFKMKEDKIVELRI